MKVVRDITRDGSICTPLHIFLECTKGESGILFYQEHKQQHPYAIYNMSWERFNDSYSKLTDYLGNQKDLEKYQKGTELFIRTKEVIEALSSFIDDTFQIMKCYIPARAVTKSITFSDRWLEKAYPKITQDYKNAISFADPIVVANNVIKHDHGRLCQLNVDAHLRGNAYGFYIQDVDSTGAIVPCVEVHPLYRGKRTAYSYNRFLIEVLAYYYLIASQAEKRLLELLKSNQIMIMNDVTRQ